MTKLLKDINSEEKCGPPNLTDAIIDELIMNSKLSPYKQIFRCYIISRSYINELLSSSLSKINPIYPFSM